MKRSGMIAIGLMIAAWLALGEWQRREYVHQRELIQGALAGQADSLINALISGVSSHRWIGPFIESQLPGTLEQLATSDSVLAVAIIAVDATQEPSSSAQSSQFVAGNADLLTLSDSAGRSWRQGGYYVIQTFELSGQSRAPMPGRGLGPGGRQTWRSDDAAESASQYKAMLVLDRTGTDAHLRGEAWSRVLLVLSGGLLIVFIGVSWRSSVRLAEAQGKARVLQAEARHLSELGHAAAGLAHETRNPLGLIRGWTQRLADSGLPQPEQQEQASAIVEECDRVTSRINEFLAFARPAEPQLDAVDVSQLVEQLGGLLESDLEARQLTLDTQAIPRGALVLADAEQLRQAIFNLLQNAIAFASERGRVTVSMVARRNKAWRLEFADDGPGPDAASIESLFEPYFTTRSTGTGLGLAIVRRIVLAHGWTVGYEPGANGGAVFWIDQIQGVALPGLPRSGLLNQSVATIL